MHLPILHQPLFRQDLREQLHLSSREFGAVVLLVCATSARFCDDLRVILSGSESEHSAGFEWFSQVQFASSIAPSADATLLQAIAVSTDYDMIWHISLNCVTVTQLGVLYLQGKSEITAWNVCGAGIRLAQNLGVHRKPAYDTELSIKDELFKRSFW